jgi:hypothetical protein
MSTATCPLCGETYLSVATVCADCRVALVPDPLDGGPADQAGTGGAGDADADAVGAVEGTVGDWPEGDDEVAYDLDDWSDDDRRALAASLRAERIAHEWRDAELVVPERWADVAEELIDVIDHPDALDVDDDADDGGAELLSALYVAADVLSGDPAASGAIIEVLELAPDLAGRLPPYGVEGRTWAAITERTVALAALLEADGDDDDVRPAAEALRGLLRDLV